MDWMALIAVVLSLLVIDLKYDVLTRKWIAFTLLLLCPHVILICRLITALLGPNALPAVIFSVFVSLYFGSRFALYLPRYKTTLSLRIRIMAGGRRIFLSALLAALVQIPICFLIYRYIREYVSLTNFVSDAGFTYIALGFFMFVGAVRILFTSRRLGIGKRVLFLFVAWIPMLNIVIGIWFCKIVKLELLREIQQTELKAARAGSAMCETKYPLLMLHGVGFRDYKYVNYWGRIPRLLIENGATVFYGHQQAWGTIEDNAREIKAKLEQILEETGCKKVNIIAHSKGGLDARYLISTLGMAEHVASLTTVSTPHKGSELVNVLSRIGEQTYRHICNFIDAYFQKLGDAHPDSYRAGKQLAPEYLETFNALNPDAEGVYYQSFAAAMTKPTSDSMLMLPSAIMKWVSGDNDGLVSIDSAQWGNFRGTFKSTGRRGVSHGDLIDLMHQDYEGFNIAEEYVAITSELKKMGY